METHMNVNSLIAPTAPTTSWSLGASNPTSVGSGFLVPGEVPNFLVPGEVPNVVAAPRRP
jgi:hypothetical protein